MFMIGSKTNTNYRVPQLLKYELALSILKFSRYSYSVEFSHFKFIKYLVVYEYYCDFLGQ